MTDAHVLENVRASSDDFQFRFVRALKGVWARRELDLMSRTGKIMTCDCLMYEDGDYASAFEETACHSTSQS